MVFVGSRFEHLKSRVRYALTSRQKYLHDRSEFLGINRYDYTEKEYRELRRLAEQMNNSQIAISNFEQDYKNIHAVDIPRLISRNRFNAFIGRFHDGSLREYYRMATKIEKAARDFDIPIIADGLRKKNLDDLSGILECRYGKLWVVD